MAKEPGGVGPSSDSSIIGVDGSRGCENVPPPG